MIIVLAFISISCSTEAEPPVQPDVYVAGTIDDQAVVWVNGESISLETTPGTTLSEAVGMYYYDGTVFILGNQCNESGIWTGLYWTYDDTGTDMHTLTGNSGHYASASDLTGVAGTLYISGDDFDATTEAAAFWTIGETGDQSMTILKEQTGEYYFAKALAVDAEGNPQIIGMDYQNTDILYHWTDNESVSEETYSDVNTNDSMDIAIDEDGFLYISGTNAENNTLMLWVSDTTYGRPAEDTDPFKKIAIHAGSRFDYVSSIGFNAEGDVVITGVKWEDTGPIATCWVYDGNDTETIELGLGYAQDITFRENGDMYVAGITDDVEACYWSVDSQGTVTQKVLDTRESPGSYAYAILTQ